MRCSVTPRTCPNTTKRSLISHCRRGGFGQRPPSGDRAGHVGNRYRTKREQTFGPRHGGLGKRARPSRVFRGGTAYYQMRMPRTRRGNCHGGRLVCDAMLSSRALAQPAAHAAGSASRAPCCSVLGASPSSRDSTVTAETATSWAEAVRGHPCSQKARPY